MKSTFVYKEQIVIGVKQYLQTIFLKNYEKIYRENYEKI